MLKNALFLLLIWFLVSCAVPDKPVDNKKTEQEGHTFTYLGAFKLPERRSKLAQGLYGSFQGEGGGAAYNSQNNSLYLSARAEDSHYKRLYRMIAEISIPEPKIGPVESLPEAEIITGYTDSVTDVISTIQTDYGRGEGHGIGGLMVYGDYLIGTIYRWHNCGDPLPVSHFYTRRSNFHKSNTVGPLTIDGGKVNGFTAPSGAMAGYMTMIPEEWQAEFGYPALTGGLHGFENGGRLMRTSFGTAAIAFNPSDFMNSSTIQGKQLIYHPYEHKMDSTFYNTSHSINGMAFVSYREEDGRDRWAVIYALTYAIDPYWDAGYKARSYDVKLFFYDPQDLLKVSRGEKKQYELKPYKTMSLGKYFYNKKLKRVKSMAYNPEQGIIYLVEVKGNGSRQVVHMFSLK